MITLFQLVFNNDSLAAFVLGHEPMSAPIGAESQSHSSISPSAPAMVTVTQTEASAAVNARSYRVTHERLGGRPGER